ncbi:MAG: alpha-amylase family glycosyl hydrolase [Thermomicrobiales bacterium]
MAHDENAMNAHVLADRTERIGVRLDPQSGLPTSFIRWRHGQEESIPLSITACLEIDGDEQYRQPRGFEYVNTNRLDAFRLLCDGATHEDDGPSETYSVATEAGGWVVDWRYTFRQSHPRLELRVVIRPPAATNQATLRNLSLDLTFTPANLSAWHVEAPGNMLRPGVTADALTEPVAIAPAGGVRGSTGLIALHQPDERSVIVVWSICRTEIGELSLRVDDRALRLSLNTGLAGRLSPGDALHYGAVHLDALDGLWPEVRDRVPDWYAPLGISTPRDRANWIDAVSIFEVQIGSSVFRGGWEYGPYPTVRDLIADLRRIKELGFDCLQMMPRQPYPSYNVHDYADITTSYGDEADLKELVGAAHALGMRVILDILLHGVIDQEVMAETVERVRTGPFFARLDEAMSNPFGAGLSGVEQMQIAWCRHILDFEPHWAGGSPPRHPLADEHPAWFMRNSAGEIIGIYTKAFDVANVAWQDYFTGAALDLVRRLDVDGFRFDAPTYNALPNWSPATQHRASHSPLGCLQLFAHLRPLLKHLKPDALLYTEPSGVLFHEVMDLVYNYDEQWLVHAVLRPIADERDQRVSVRSGRELAAWFRDRNAVLPRGARIAHHIDSHDTFWWPLPGHKWRREQYGIEAARALLAIFALSGGAYMTFVGGECALDDEIRRVHHLRQTLPEIGHGSADYDAVTVDHDAIYAVVRRRGRDCSVLVVNLSDQPLEATFALDADRLGLGAGDSMQYDAWNDRSINVAFGSTGPGNPWRDIRLPFAAYEPRLLVVRPADAARK